MKSGRYLDSVRRGLPEEAQIYLDQAFSGDALSARRLMIVAPRRLRGHIAFLAYQSRLNNPAYREIVKAVWSRETRHLLTTFWRPQIIRRILARADFRIPELSGPVVIFRPLEPPQARKAKAELCWLPSREAAVAEAARIGGTTRILQATIDPGDIIYWGENDGAPEIVGRHPVRNAVTVGPASLMRSAAAMARPAR